MQTKNILKAMVPLFFLLLLVGCGEVDQVDVVAVKGEIASKHYQKGETEHRTSFIPMGETMMPVSSRKKNPDEYIFHVAYKGTLYEKKVSKEEFTLFDIGDPAIIRIEIE